MFRPSDIARWFFRRAVTRPRCPAPPHALRVRLGNDISMEDRITPSLPEVSYYPSGAEDVPEYQTSGTFYLWRINDVSAASTVNLSYSGTATNGTDYTVPTTAYFQAESNTSDPISFTVYDDTTYEGDESIILNIEPGSGYTIDSNLSSGTGWIRDDETPPVPPTVSMSLIQNPVEGGSQGLIGFTRIDGDLSQPLTVYYSFGTPNTATPGDDYEPLSGSVTFPADVDYVELPITVHSDTDFDPFETITIELAADPSYEIALESWATVYIEDRPLVSVDVVTGGQEGGVDGLFQFTRSGDTTQELTVNFFVGGSAVPDLDYTQLPTSITFVADQLLYNLPVVTIDDIEAEPTKYVTVWLNDGSEYVAESSGSEAVKITDDDGATVYVQGTADASEAGPISGNFAFTREGGSISDPLTLTYTVGGTATPGTDYTALSGTVTFQANETAVNVSVDPIIGVPEHDGKTISVFIEPDPSYFIGANGSIMLWNNTAPIAVDDGTYSIHKNHVLSVSEASGVLGNDYDPAGDPITASLVAQASHGTVTLNADGSFQYTPTTGYAGTDSFSYLAIDSYGNESSPATVQLNVFDSGFSNRPPVAVDDLADVWQRNRVEIAVLDNDSDPDADLLSITEFTEPANGSIALNSDNTFTYVPNDGFEGTDSFTYTVSDGYGGTSTATVFVTTAHPVFAFDDEAATQQDTATVITVMGNDVGITEIESFTQPAHGTVSLSGSDLMYTPAAGYVGADSFEYTGSDGTTSESATVQVTVEGGIGDFVWFDRNGNGIQDVGEQGIPGVLVELLNELDESVATAVTDENGEFRFPIAGLPDGYYRLRFQPPEEIEAIVGVEYTIKDAPGAPPGTSSAVYPDGLTDPFFVTAAQPNAGKDAGLKPKLVVIPQKGTAIFAAQKQEGSVNVIVPGDHDYGADSLKPLDRNQNVYGLELDSYDAKTGIAVVKEDGVRFAAKEAKAFYRDGANAVGLLLEAGHEEDEDPLQKSDKFYWSQYVKLDKNESVLNSFKTWHHDNGKPPIDGKYYIDGPVFGLPGLQNSYELQELDVHHPMYDGPSVQTVVNLEPVNVGGVPQKHPVVLTLGGQKWLVMKLPTRQSVIDEEIKAVKAKNGNQEFRVTYANTFQTYVVEKQGTNPLGYFYWSWNVQLDSMAKTLTVTVTGQNGDWVNGSDPAVWNKAPATPPG